MTNPTEILDRARRIGEEVLFPAALQTDASDGVPMSSLDLLAEEGFYGLAGPLEAGGMGIDILAGCDVIETLAGACLTTTFVWMQHHGAVFATTYTDRASVREEWLEPLCCGDRRAGIALAGLHPGPSSLDARPVEDGWILDGMARWVTGWGRIDVVHVAARHGEQIVRALVDARQSDTLTVQPLRLVAVNASATVTVALDGHFVPAERVTGIEPFQEWGGTDPTGLRLNGSLALGVAGRCCSMLGPSPLDDELAACRTALNEGTAETMPTARARASEFAMRAASILAVTSGARSVLMDQHVQRLAREALFLLVFGSRPPIRSALLERLG